MMSIQKILFSTAMLIVLTNVLTAFIVNHVTWVTCQPDATLEEIFRDGGKPVIGDGERF